MAIQESSSHRVEESKTLAIDDRRGDGDGDNEDGEIEEETRTVPPSKALRASSAAAVYIPPAKRRRLLQQQGQDEDNSDTLRQQETWINQQRVIHGTINRLNEATIKPLIQELFQKVNLIRLRGVLCKSTLVAALSSPKYSNVYAALISVINSKLPEVGELLVTRSILAFRKYYQRREKGHCQAVCVFIAHLFHQAVVHELLVLQILSLLLDGTPTDDSVEVAVELLQTSGHALLEVSPAGVRACVDRLRILLQEGKLNQRVEYKIEQLLKLRKAGFKDLPSVPEELDLVERDDQITHETSLDDESLNKQDELDTFHHDPDYQELEKEWAAIRAEILGEGDDSSDDDDDDDDDSSAGSENEDKNERSDQQQLAVATDKKNTDLAVIQDLTEQDLVHLRRTIYLTIMSSATFEECTHKLARIDIPPGQEMELINMLIECCSQERTFLRYYGLIAARFCLLDDRWRIAFMDSFKQQYTTIHRLETNKLRNVAKLFAHLLHSDAIPWSVLEIIHLNEDETTSSSRIFIKIVIQEMAEAMGIAKLKARFETNVEEWKMWYAGMFPKDNVRNTRYAINFFTSIGLGPLTDDLREFLKNAPKLILAKAKEAALAKKADDSDDSSSVSSTSSSSSSSSSSSTSSSSTYSSTSSRSRSSSSSSSSYSSSGSSSSESSYSRRRGRSSRRRKYRSRSSSYTSSSSSRSDSRDDSRKGRKGSKKDTNRRSKSPPKEVIRREDSHGDRAKESKSSRTKTSREDQEGKSKHRSKKDEQQRTHEAPNRHEHDPRGEDEPKKQVRRSPGGARESPKAKSRESPPSRSRRTTEETEPNERRSTRERDEHEHPSTGSRNKRSRDRSESSHDHQDRSSRRRRRRYSSSSSPSSRSERSRS